jgi:hypothetical protein
MTDSTDIHLNKPDCYIKDDDITEMITANVDCSFSGDIGTLQSHPVKYNLEQNVSPHTVYNKDELVKIYTTKIKLFEQLGYDELDEHEVCQNAKIIKKAIDKRGVKSEYDCLVLYGYEMGWIQQYTSSVAQSVLPHTTSMAPHQNSNSIRRHKKSKRSQRHEQHIESEMGKNLSTRSAISINQQNKQSSFEKLHQQISAEQTSVENNTTGIGNDEKSSSEQETMMEYNEKNIIENEISKGQESCTIL